jgi:hypothetical protein
MWLDEKQLANMKGTALLGTNHFWWAYEYFKQHMVEYTFIVAQYLLALRRFKAI